MTQRKARRIILSVALSLAFASTAAAEKNTGSGTPRPHYSEGQCEKLWWEIWEHYRDANDETAECRSGDGGACRIARLYVQLFNLSVDEYIAAGCLFYEGTLGPLPGAGGPIVIGTPEPVLGGF